MVTKLAPVYFYLFLILCLFYTLPQTATAACQCQFDGNDSDDCVVYGQLGDRVLIPWSKASQACLDTYKIKVESVSPAQLTSMFPNRDGTGGNVNSFVNWLKNDSGSSANTIKIGFDQFWEDRNGLAYLKDTITAGGETTDCQVSTTDCYNVIKSYFRVEPGASEMTTIGKQLYAKQAVNKELEQGIMRDRLCQEGDTPECGALDEQVKTIKSENPEKACSAFALGPADTPIPPCDDDDETNENDTSSGASKLSRIDVFLYRSLGLTVILGGWVGACLD